MVTTARVLMGTVLLAAVLAGGRAWAAGAPARLDLDGDGRADLIIKSVSPPANYSISARLSTGASAGLWSWPASGSAGRELVTARDFTGDGKGDLLWSLNGQFELWVMDGLTIRRQVPLPSIGAAWNLRGVGDFDGDQRDDILWQDFQNGLHMWLFRRPGFVESIDMGVLASPWRVVAVADFSGDGRADVVLRNQDTGTLYEWQMNGFTIEANGPISLALDLSWSVAASGDFNGDGRADLLWRNSTSTRVWNLSGFEVLTTFSMISIWPLAVDDFNGDGRAEVLRAVGVIPSPGPGCDLLLMEYLTVDPGGPPGGGVSPPMPCIDYNYTYLQPGMF